jgi:hypothetical protein
MRFILLVSLLLSFPVMAEKAETGQSNFSVPKALKIEAPCDPKEQLTLPEFFN